MTSGEHVLCVRLSGDHDAQHATLLVRLRPHAATWSLTCTDVDTLSHHRHDEVVYEACIAALRARLAAAVAAATSSQPPHATALQRALLEWLDAGALPHGTRRVSEDVVCSLDDDDDEGGMRLTLRDGDVQAMLRLRTHSRSAVQHFTVDEGSTLRTRAGDEHAVRGDATLYDVPCAHDDAHARTTRIVLCDHDHDATTQLCARFVLDADAHVAVGDVLHGKLTRSDGATTTPCTMRVDAVWTSARTLTTYVTAATLHDDETSRAYTLRAVDGTVHEQTSLAACGLVACACLVTSDTSSLRGCMLHDGHAPATTTQLLARVGARVRDALQRACPRDADAAWYRDTLLRDTSASDDATLCEAAWHCDALATTMHDALLAPLRALIDRGGHAWRSVVLHTCYEALCNDDASAAHLDGTPLMVLVELLHVGSLIVDDVEDEATRRRGGDCVHALYGIACAVNAGTFAYFAAPQLARLRTTLPRDVVARVLAVHGDLLRVGHIGQGMDIHGLHALVPAAVASGDVCTLRAALYCVHAYKTGSFVAATCRMACALARADAATTRAMAAFGTALGVAYQIADDVRAVCAFARAPEAFASDVATGKVTAPVVEALAVLPLREREALWCALQRRPRAQRELADMVALIERADAASRCLRAARAMIDAAWRVVAPVLRDSRAKLLLRSVTLALVADL